MKLKVLSFSDEFLSVEFHQTVVFLGISAIPYFLICSHEVTMFGECQPIHVNEVVCFEFA